MNHVVFGKNMTTRDLKTGAVLTTAGEGKLKVGGRMGLVAGL